MSVCFTPEESWSLNDGFSVISEMTLNGVAK